MKFKVGDRVRLISRVGYTNFSPEHDLIIVEYPSKIADAKVRRMLVYSTFL